MEKLNNLRQAYAHYHKRELKALKKDALTVVKDFGYGQEIRDKIIFAESENEIYNALTTARKRSK